MRRSRATRPSVSRRGVTRVEAGVAAAIAVLAGSLLLVFSSPSRASETQRASEDAEQIRAAAEAWKQSNSVGCPTLSVLTRDGLIDAGTHTDDPWGERYRVTCSAGKVVVLSAGADRRAGTADDVSAPRS